MTRRLRLLLGLVVLQAVALLAVLGTTYLASQNVLLRFSESIAARISRDATAYTENYLEPANAAAELTHRMLEVGVLDSGDRSTLGRFFLELLQVREDFDGVYVGFETGEFLYVNRAAAEEPGPLRVKKIVTRPVRTVTLDWYDERLDRVGGETDAQDDYDPRSRPWYQAALETRAAVWTPPYIFFTSQAPGITVAVPVEDLSEGALTGAVGVDIQLAELSQFLGDLGISPRGSAAIVAENGDIIAHSRETYRSDADGFNTVAEGSDAILRQAAEQIEGGLSTLLPGEIRLSRFEAGGEVWIGSVMRLGLERTPWTVVTYLPEADILAPLYRVRNTAVIISIIALIATAAMGVVYARAIGRT